MTISSLVRRHPVRIAIATLLLLALVGCAAARLVHDPAAGFLTAPVATGAVEETVSALGKVQPARYVDVGAQASGQLKRIAVAPGAIVQAGDLLAEIDPQVQAAKVESDAAERDRLVAMLAEAEAQARYAAGEQRRQQQLARAGAARADVVAGADRDAATSAAQVRALRAQIAQADSTLKADRAQLGYTRIYAPIAGTVVSVDAREGQTINANYSAPVLMRIADLRTMTVWTQVSEADIGALRPGMRLWFTTLGFGERRWSARLRQILPAPPKPATAGEGGGTGGGASSAGGSAGNVVLYTALFDVPNGDGLLRPEMSAQVFFVTAAARRGPVVPMAALEPATGRGRYTVRVVEGRRVETRTVTIGAHDRFTGAVLSGLRPGEQIVTGRAPDDGKPSLLGFRL